MKIIYHGNKNRIVDEFFIIVYLDHKEYVTLFLYQNMKKVINHLVLNKCIILYSKKLNINDHSLKSSIV